MKNKKLLKALATITIGAVASVGCFTVAACSSCDDDKHTHSYTQYESAGEAGHYEKCECGDKKSEVSEHVWENDEDTTCDACGYVREVGGSEDPGHTEHVWSETYVSDGKNGHYQTCTVDGCNEVKRESHRYDDDQDTSCNSNGCGYVRELGAGPGDDHTEHVWGTEYVSDGANGHHLKCTYEGCNAVSETVAHVYDDDQDTTCNSSGCGYVREVGGDPIPEKTIYETLAERADNIIAEDFATTTTADIKVHNGTYGAAGVYVRREDGSALVSGEYKVDNQALVLGTGSKVQNVLAVVDFGIVSGIVEGYFEFKMSADATGNYNNVNFVNQGNTVLKIMASGSKFVYTLNGTEEAAENAVTAAKNTTYKVEFKFDLTNKKLTFKINGTAIFTDVDSNIDAITGFTVNTSNGGQRNNTVDNIAVCGASVALADYQADLAGKLDAKAAEMTGEGGTHTSDTAKGKVEAAVTAAKTAINAAETHVAALAAYNDAVKELNLIAGDAYEHVVNYIYDQYPVANYTNPAAKAIYDAQIAKILAETDTAKLTVPDADAETPVEAGETLAAVLTELDKMDNDATAYEKYIAKVGEDLQLKEFPHTNYRLNDKYQELMEGADVKQHLGEATYADAVKEFDAVVADLKAELAKLDTDDKIIEARAKEFLASLDDEIDSLLADAEIEEPSADLTTAINAEKPTLEALTKDVIDKDGNYAGKTTIGEGEHAQEVYAYEIAMRSKIETAYDNIQKIISSAGTSVEEAIAQAEIDYADHVSEMLDTVKDPALKETLAADTSAPKFSEIVFVTDEDSEDKDNATTVGTKRKTQENKYDEWLKGKLAAKTYSVTLNGVKLSTTVKYGETLDISKLDPTNDDTMIDPADSKLYDANNEVYAGGKVYGDLVLHYNLIQAVTDKTIYEFDWTQIDATDFASRKHGGTTEGDQVYLTQDDLTGVNAFIKPIVANSEVTDITNVLWRSGTDKNLSGVAHTCIIQCAQNAEGFTVHFNGTGTFVVAVRGGGNTTNTTFYLKDSNGTKIAATYNNKAADSKFSEADNVYTMYSKTYQTYTFEITASGDYTFCVETGTCRIGALKVNDIVKTPKILAESVTINLPENADNNLALPAEGEDPATLQLTATTTPDGVNGKVVWTSSDETVATVSANGLVTAVACGYVTITATIDSKTNTITLNVGGYAEYLSGLVAQVTAVTTETANEGRGVNASNADAFAAAKQKALTDLDAATSKTAADGIVGEFTDAVALMENKVATVTLNYADKTPLPFTVALTGEEGAESGTFSISDEVKDKCIKAKPGYKLVGWHKLVDDEEVAVDINNLTVTGDVQLYAKYTAVVVTFKDGENDLEIEATIEDGKLKAPTATLTKPDYTFEGWLLNGKAYEDFDKEIYDDLILTVNWKANKAVLDIVSLGSAGESKAAGSELNNGFFVSAYGAASLVEEKLGSDTNKTLTIKTGGGVGAQKDNGNYLVKNAIGIHHKKGHVKITLTFKCGGSRVVQVGNLVNNAWTTFSNDATYTASSSSTYYDIVIEFELAEEGDIYIGSTGGAISISKLEVE